MALNFFLSLRTGPMVVSWNTGSCRQPAVVSSYVQCQCLAVAVQDRRISREVTKLQPAACQGFSPPPPPPSRASLPNSLLSIRFQSISLLLHLDSKKIIDWPPSKERRYIQWPGGRGLCCDQCPWLHHLCSRRWRMWLACQLRGAAAAAGWKWSRGGMDWGARGGPTGNMDTGHIGHNKPNNSLFRSS